MAAPNTSTYTLVVPDTADLPNSRTLQAINGILIADSGSGNNLTIVPYGNLLSLFNYDSTGFIAYDSASNTFSPVSFNGGTTINITNPTGISNPTITLGVINDTSTQKVNIEDGGIPISTRSKINFLEGDNISISVVDNFSNNSADITIIGTGQPFSPNLVAIAGLTPSAGSLIVGNGTTYVGLPVGSPGTVLNTLDGVHLSWQPAIGGGTVTSIGATTSSSPALIITGSPVTHSGNINFELSTALNNFSALSGTGLLVEIASGFYANRAINVGSANLTLSNGNGVVGNPTLDLSTTPSVSSITIQNMPVLSTDGVNKQYADALIAGLNFKNSCKVVQVSNFVATYNNGIAGVGATLTNADTFVALVIDGVTVSLNDRVLVDQQTDIVAYQNGIYTVTDQGSGSTAWVLTRATDYDTLAEIKPGDIVPVLDGDLYGGSSWLQLATVATIGTSDIVFVQFTSHQGVTSITAGTGLTGGTITSTGTIAIDDTTVIPGSYTRADITINAQGQITAASDGGIVLSGDVTGSGPLNNPIVTNLTLTLDQIPLATSSINSNSQKIINLANGTNPNDAVNYSQLTAIPGSSVVNQNTSSVTMVSGRSYYINNGASLVTLTLPITAAQGDTFIINGGSSGGWKVAQNSGQTIHMDGTPTTTGTGGSLASTAQYQCITISCIISNTTFVVCNSIGSITVT